MKQYLDITLCHGIFKLNGNNVTLLQCCSVLQDNNIFGSDKGCCMVATQLEPKMETPSTVDFWGCFSVLADPDWVFQKSPF